ncbi:MAG: PqqD family peptide modification chaperone [Desulfobacteraceae bacterium]|nr:PqqD family peptide modification chaperone [Desulfobacteraceae bacterium]
MSESLFSTYWYRVAKLKPVLRDVAIVSRHVYRNQPWYVLRNSLNGRNHRFNAAAYALIGQMDGRRTVQEIWENAGRRTDNDPPTQDEVIQLLGQLHAADLVQSDILPSTLEIAKQDQGGQPNGWKQRISNPFSLRFPLVDPDRFLEKWQYLTAPLYTRGAFILWLLIVLSALVAAGLHWPEISDRLSHQFFSPFNLLLLWLVYPVVKLFHEFGHAFAVKKWGGEVHEMGIILLALNPIPYVDASTSASFPDKQQRIAVAATGMAVELLLSALALFVWLNVQTGLVSAIAFNVMLIGSVSTVLFNGNPLLRYDGYYIFADMIEIPNLGQRSTQYLAYLIQRRLLENEAAESPVTAPGEKYWFMIYGPISFCYRIAIMVGLVLLVGSRYFVVGILLAIWGAVSLMVFPAVRALTRFLSNPAVRQRRSRLLGIGGGLGLSLILLLFILPVPLWTTTQGVVWLPEQSAIRAGTDCEVVELLAPVEELVFENSPLIRGTDPLLEMQIQVYKARLEELFATYNAHPLSERVERKAITDEIELVKGDLRHAEEKLEKLIVLSPTTGSFILFDADNIQGRFIKKGELLGYIISEHRPTVRAVVSQADIGLVRERLTGVEVRLSEKVGVPIEAEVQRIVPSADYNLPSAALGTTGGGGIPVDPTDPEGLRSLVTFFQLDINLPKQIRNPYIGGRVYVRISHGTMPLAMQWARSFRQLLLWEFYV